MPADFNWIDLVIGLLLLYAIIRGIRVGLLKSLFAVIGILAGLLLAKAYYSQLSLLLPKADWLPAVAADTISFLTIFTVTALVVHYCGEFVVSFTARGSLRTLDQFCGSFIGLALGIALVGALLITLSAFPLVTSFHEQVEQSFLAQPIIENVLLFYDEISGLLNLQLPKITVYTEDIGAFFNSVNTETSFYKIDFRALDQATCFVCGGAVEFLGFLDNGKGAISPKFICTSCGRTSDGCQTYEGYHALYDQCPVELGNQGYRFDCGIWTNNSFHRPLGPCPVCGMK
jgi:membrane protein required for colicin V production